MAVLVDCVFWLVLFPETVRSDTVAYQITFVSLHTQSLLTPETEKLKGYSDETFGMEME